MTDLPDQLQRKLATLPDTPGVYLWKDAEGNILYVGKAKRLSSRVRSYFTADFADSPKNRLLRTRIADVETIVVPDEAQALVLENNLIKEYRPRFNVVFKDDKSYPSIAVTMGEPFPRVLVTRRRNIPGARYFGPFTDVGCRVAVGSGLSRHDRRGARFPGRPHRGRPGAGARRHVRRRRA
jgi:excinuclease ABC subunit C